MSRMSEWEIGSEIMGRDIYLKLKGFTDSKFSHSFLSINDAEKFANQILLITKNLKELSCGKCFQCNQYITNGDTYYEFENDIKIHKNCLGNYAENHIINIKLKPKYAKEFETRNIYYEHKNK